MKFLVDKIANKLGKKGLMYTNVTDATSNNDSYEIDLELVPDKFKQKHAMSFIESAFLNETDCQLIIICGSVFLPYISGIKVISVMPHDNEYIAVNIEISSDEVKEMSLYQ